MSNLVITILGIGFIFLMSILGGSLVFLFKKEPSPKFNSLFLGIASGIMLSASIWSLIIPALEQSSNYGKLRFLPTSLGIILGAVFLVVMARFLPFLVNRKKKGEKKEISKFAKVFFVIVLHKIPEGLAIGLAFGNAFLIGEVAAFYSALWLAIGFGIENFPEGSAVILPFSKNLKNKSTTFMFSLLSGLVEPIMAILGILLTTTLSSIMPWFLAFSAGAMLFVVADELLPETKLSHPSNIGAWGLIIGFVVMMILDLVL